MEQARLVSKEEMERLIKIRESHLRNIKKEWNREKPGFVRFKVYVNGVYDKVITIRDYNYTSFMKPFHQKYPEYKNQGPCSNIDHTTRIMNLIIPDYQGKNPARSVATK